MKIQHESAVVEPEWLDDAGLPLVVEVDDLHVSFEVYGGRVYAVNGVSFEVRMGEVLGVVGESGCGKSITGLSLLRLIPRPGQVDRGSIRLHTSDGVLDVAAMDANGPDIRRIRGRVVSMIFQEPMRSLHPMFPIGQQITEILQQHFPMSRQEALRRAVELLERVGLPQPARVVRDYPHQLSGGMRQRAMIAMALACEPQLLIADEPTTALDVTIQAQILELIQSLQSEKGMAVLLITHDMGVIAETAHRVIVMYLGEVVETASAEQLFSNAQHPYTQGLLRAIPNLVHPPKQLLYSMPGTVPELRAPPSRCVFGGRCPYAYEACTEEPPLVGVEPGHYARCWLFAQEGPNG